MSEAAVQRRPRRSWLRRLIWGLSLVLTLVAGLILFGIGTRMDVPDWARQRIEARIERNLNGLQIEFGQLHVVVNRGWRPRLGLRDVTLRRADGTVVAQLADAQASLAMRPLLRGLVQPKSISLSGLYATLRRENDRVALSLSQDSTALKQAETLPQLIEQWDSLLTTPALSALASVETEALTLRYEDARTNRVWTLDGGHARLARDGETVDLSGGFSLLSGRDYVGSVEANYRSAIGDTKADFGILIDTIASEDIASQSLALAWLAVLRAPISGSLRGGIDSAGALLPLSASLQIGEGVLQPADQTLPIPFHGASSYLTFLPDQRVLRFNELSVSSGWGSGTMEGQAQLHGLESGRLTDLVGQLRFTNLDLNPRDLYENPLHLSGVDADFKLELAPFRLRLGEMLVRDGDSKILLSGSLRAGDGGWDYDLRGHVDQVEATRIKELWPEAAPPKPRQWVRENLYQGTARDVNIVLRGRDSQKPFVYLDLGFEDLSLQFQKHMPPLVGAAGQFSIYGTRLVAMATSGLVTADEGGDIDIAGTSFIIPDMTVKGGGPGIARVKARGAVTAALSLLNRPPLSILKETPLPVDMADGRVSVTGTLSLPLKPKVPVEDIRYHYQGRLSSVASTVLVPGHRLRADSLVLKGDQGQVSVSGSGQLSGVPASARWSMLLGKDVEKASRVSGTVTLSAETVDRLNIGLPPGSVFGRGSGDYAVDLVKGQPPELTLTSDLDGVGLRIPALAWGMSEGATGQLSVSATLGDAAEVTDLRLDAPGLSARGSVTTRAGGGLDQARFSNVQVGRWMTGSATLVGRGAAPPEVQVTGGTLDLRHSPFGATGASQSGGNSGPIVLSLDQLRVTDSIALHGFRGRFSTLGGFNGSFTGQLNGQVALSGQVVPQNGGTATRIQSQDAGGVFRAAGVLRHGSGGSFDMTLIPARTPGEFNGEIAVKNTRIKDAPSMAALINALSLVGLVDELAGQGILFTEVDARFRLGKDYLQLHESSAVGPSIGLSLDGTYNLANSVLNMRGVISPIYLVNAIGSLLTRKGEGLIGFAFTLKGTADNPQVQVNPLSGLAPGMFREIFRGPAPTVPGREPAAQPDKPTSDPLLGSGEDR